MIAATRALTIVALVGAGAMAVAGSVHALAVDGIGPAATFTRTVPDLPAAVLPMDIAPSRGLSRTIVLPVSKVRVVPVSESKTASAAGIAYRDGGRRVEINLPGPASGAVQGLLTAVWKAAPYGLAVLAMTAVLGLFAAPRVPVPVRASSARMPRPPR